MEAYLGPMSTTSQAYSTVKGQKTLKDSNLDLKDGSIQKLFDPEIMKNIDLESIHPFQE